VRTPVVALAFVLAGCAHALTEAELAQARKPFADCVIREVARLDDGKSDPLSVANGIAPACALQYEELTRTLMQEAAAEKGKDFLRQRTREDELQSITSAILIYRVAHARK